MKTEKMIVLIGGLIVLALIGLSGVLALSNVPDWGNAPAWVWPLVIAFLSIIGFRYRSDYDE